MSFLQGLWLIRNLGRWFLDVGLRKTVHLSEFFGQGLVRTQVTTLRFRVRILFRWRGASANEVLEDSAAKPFWFASRFLGLYRRLMCECVWKPLFTKT